MGVVKSYLHPPRRGRLETGHCVDFTRHGYGDRGPGARVVNIGPASFALWVCLGGGKCRTSSFRKRKSDTDLLDVRRARNGTIKELREPPHSKAGTVSSTCWTAAAKLCCDFKECNVCTPTDAAVSFLVVLRGWDGLLCSFNCFQHRGKATPRTSVVLPFVDYEE